MSHEMELPLLMLAAVLLHHPLILINMAENATRVTTIKVLQHRATILLTHDFYPSGLAWLIVIKTHSNLSVSCCCFFRLSNVLHKSSRNVKKSMESISCPVSLRPPVV